jgi:outer membrane protein TolC
MTPPRITGAVVVASIAVALAPPIAAQQAAASSDTLTLAELHAAALVNDPRAGQAELLARRDSLRHRSLQAEWLPRLSLTARSQYQSDVVTLPFTPPGGAVPQQPHDSYDMYVGVNQSLYDPTFRPRRNVQRAELLESQARLESTLHAQRTAVNDAYFEALRAQVRHAEVEAAISALDTRLELSRSRVRLGAALPSEAAMLEAELLARRQAADQLAAMRLAAFAVLEHLTGMSVDSATTLSLPSLAEAVAGARTRMSELRERPEYGQFEQGRQTLRARQDVVQAQSRPRLSTFGRAGHGRPGLNPLATEFDSYWLAGIQVEWSPWNWGTTKRDRQELQVQQAVIETEEAAFTESLLRGAEVELAEIDRLSRTVESDARIVALREEVLRETRARFEEGVITSAEYVERDTDLLVARLTRASHAVELAHAQARFLTMAGLEVPR